MTDRVTQRPDPDPYAVLGVTTEASDDDLDHAFRGLARQHHPDTRPSEPEPDADQRLQESSPLTRRCATPSVALPTTAPEPDQQPPPARPHRDPDSMPRRRPTHRFGWGPCVGNHHTSPRPRTTMAVDDIETYCERMCASIVGTTAATTSSEGTVRCRRTLSI
jgi:hypothetical protein